MNPYGDIIQEHFRNPHNRGSMEAPDIRHEDVNPLCGDRVRIELALGPNGEVREARFQGDLCMIAMAASSLLTDMIVGMPLASAGQLPAQQLLDALGAEIRPARIKCALLPLEVLRAGVESHRRRE